MPEHIKRANITNDACNFRIKAFRSLEDRFQWKRRRPTLTRYIKRFVNRGVVVEIQGVKQRGIVAAIKPDTTHVLLTR